MIGTILAAGSLGVGIGGLFGKKKKYKRPPMPRLGPEGKWAQETLYADIEKGLTGGRFLPSAYPEIRRAYQKAYPEAQWRLRSYLNRFVPRRDVRVRNFAGKMLDRSYYGTLQDLKEAEQLEVPEQRSLAMNMAGQVLSQERRAATGGANIYGQYLSQAMRMPTFESTLAGGLGAAGGWMSAAQRFSQLMADKGGR